MKQLFFLLWLTCMANVSFSQIYGDIAKDKRPVVQQIDYAIKSSHLSGQLVFDIIVDEKGNVTSCQLNPDKSNINSTPTMMKAKNRILMDLKFQAGYIYPQYHHGEVVVKVYQSVD